MINSVKVSRIKDRQVDTPQPVENDVNMSMSTIGVLVSF